MACELRQPIKFNENSLKDGIRLHSLDFSETIHSELFRGVAKSKFFIDLFLMEKSQGKEVLGFNLGCNDCSSEHPDFPLMEATSYSMEENTEGIVSNNTSAGNSRTLHTVENWVLPEDKRDLLRNEIKLIVENSAVKSLEISFPVREFIEYDSNGNGAWVWRPPHSLDSVCFTGAALD